MHKIIKNILALALITAVLMPARSFAEVYSGYPYMFYDFEENAENAVNWANAEYAASDDGAANSAGSLEICMNGDGQMISVPVKLTKGETYNISCYIKPEDDVNVNYINFIFWFKQKMEDGSTGKSEGFSTARVNNVKFKANVWTKVTTQYTFEGQANINGQMTDAVGDGRVSIRFGGGNLSEINNKNKFSYKIDDLVIEPELKESKVTEPFEKVNIINNGDFSSETDDEWIGSNAEFKITEDVPNEDCNSDKSMLVTQTVRAGKVYQNISVKPNTKYKLTFWAKGESAGNITSAFEWGDGDSKEYEYLISSNFSFAGEWTKYSVLYQTSSAIPKNVRFYIHSKKLQKTEFSLTDIELCEWPFDTLEVKAPDEVTTPEIGDIVTSGYLIRDNSIFVNAEYLGPNPQSGLVQLFKQSGDGNWASIKTAEFTGDDFSYTFKASDIGQNVKVRIIPMDTEGNVGGYRETELGVVHDIYEVNSEFLSGLSDPKITAKAEITNWSGEDENIVCMVLLYDEKNCCISSNYKSCYASFGVCNKLEVEVPNTGKCRKAKMFIWKGESDINTKMMPVVKCTTLAY